MLKVVFLVLFSTCLLFADNTTQPELNTVQLLDNIREDVKGGIISIVESIKEISAPALEMTKAKIISEAYSNLLWNIPFLVSLYLWLFTGKNLPKYSPHEWCKVSHNILYGIITTALMTVSIAVTTGSMKRILAPDFYAVKELLTLAGLGGR